MKITSELTDKQFQCSLYLAVREFEEGEFQFKLIQSRISNKQCFIKQRQPLIAERFNLTPQEELYAEFFRNEKEQIALLTDEELRERIEEWSKIAFEARARLYASKTEQNERRAKKGVKATVQSDELSSNAINNITERSIKLSKRERQIQGLIKIGIDRATAEAMVPDIEKMSKGRAAVAVDKLKDINGSSSVEKLTDAIMNPPAPRPFVNPFAKKEEVPTKQETQTQVTIIDESTVVIRETVTETKPEEKKELGFKNPFAK